MEIKTNGQRNITLDFNAPKKFRLLKDGQEIPYLRTGKNSFRLGRNVDGVLNLEEIIEQPKIVKPMQLKAQQMALVNPNDVLMINQAAQQLEVEQNLLSETQKRVEQTQAYLDVQQQKINETVLSVQGLETDNSERITATENGIFNLAGNLAKTEQNLVDGIEIVNKSLQEHKNAENPHGITKKTIGLDKVDNTSDMDKPISKAVQNALDEKADKDEIQAIREELGEYQEKNDRFTNALSNYTGGLAGNQLPDGGLEGQILAKRSDMSGDAEWVNSSASITIDDELSLTSENPVQNKVITNKINSEVANLTTRVGNLETGKQDKLTQVQLDAINSGANTTNIGQIATNTSDIAGINALIPNQATTSNQLADQGFVNSSIATNTANFIGTFNSVAELEAYSGTLTNNDYAFVQTTDTAGNTLYDRYKWNGTEWLFEYELNNSSFTASQWNAINSGATDTLIDQITTNQNNITTIQTTIGGYGNIVTHNVSEFATSAQGTKADTAVQPNDLATVATSGSYTDLDNKPTIGSGVLSIQKTGTTIGTFSANATENNIIDVSIDSTDVTTALGYTPVNPSSLATVATTGDYDDLSNKPTIPTVNDATLTIQKNGVDVQTFTANQATNATANITVPTDTADLTNGAGFITGITSSDVTSALGYTPYNSTNPSGYQTAADVASAISGKQDTLVSGTNIKTINNQSILGSGNIDIQSGGGVWGSITGTLSDQTDLQNALDEKVNKSGDTMTGQLRINRATGSNFVEMLSGMVQRGTKPTSSITLGFMQICDKNGQWLGKNQFQYTTTGEAKMELTARSVTSGALAKLSVGFDNNNNAFASAPATSTTRTNATDIVTRGFLSSSLSPYALSSSLSAVATSGSYNDLSNKPTIPTVNNSTIEFTQGGVSKGSFTLNQATGTTIELDAGGAGGYHPDLLSFQWSDHLLNNVSWLRADTFSWQDGTVYSDAYNHLSADILGKTLQSETIDAVTVQFYLADDGHKICPASEESNVASIYTNTGVAWYYVLDTTNQRFKLPRTKFGFTGLRDSVGKYVAPGLPNITGEFTINVSQGSEAEQSGAFFKGTQVAYKSSGTSGKAYAIAFDASHSSSIYGNSTTVQPPATQMYLYFYVGQFSQSAIEQTAGITAETLNAKANTDLSNVSASDMTTAMEGSNTPVIVETYKNGDNWYRVWSDGWCEQRIWCNVIGATNAWSYNIGNFQLLKQMKDTTYTVILWSDQQRTNNGHAVAIGTKTTTDFKLSTYNCDVNGPAIIYGYIAE